MTDLRFEDTSIDEQSMRNTQPHNSFRLKFYMLRHHRATYHPNTD